MKGGMTILPVTLGIVILPVMMGILMGIRYMHPFYWVDDPSSDTGRQWEFGPKHIWSGGQGSTFSNWWFVFFFLILPLDLGCGCLGYYSKHVAVISKLKQVWITNKLEHLGVTCWGSTDCWAWAEGCSPSKNENYQTNHPKSSPKHPVMS